MKKNIKLYLSIFFLLFLAGCTKQTNQSDKPIVYASFYPIHDLAESVVEDTVELRTFMPKEQDPHFWEPSAKNIKELSEADLLIVNGANMEKWIGQIEEALPDLKILTLSEGINLITYRGGAALGDFQYMATENYAKNVYPIEFGHTHEENMRIAFYRNKENLSKAELIKKGKEMMQVENDELIQQGETIEVESEKVYKVQMGHEYGNIHYQIPEDGEWVFYSDRLSDNMLSYKLLDRNGKDLNEGVLLEGSTTGMDKITFDPHSWLSIRNAKRYVNDIEFEFATLYPQHERLYRRNSSRFVGELTELDFEYRDKFKEIAFKEFVVTHYAFAYLAKDFDLVQYSLQELTSTEAPSLKTIREAIYFARRNDIKTIFYELGLEKQIAETIAGEIEGQALPLISMEYMSREQKRAGDSYIDFMRLNLENIYESLRN